MVLWLATTTPRTRLATLKRHTLQTLSILELLSSHSRDLSSFSWCTARFALFFSPAPVRAATPSAGTSTTRDLALVIQCCPRRDLQTPLTLRAACCLRSFAVDRPLSRFPVFVLVCSFALSGSCVRSVALARSRSRSRSPRARPAPAGGCVCGGCVCGRCRACRCECSSKARCARGCLSKGGAQQIAADAAAVDDAALPADDSAIPTDVQPSPLHPTRLHTLRGRNSPRDQATFGFHLHHYGQGVLVSTSSTGTQPPEEHAPYSDA